MSKKIIIEIDKEGVVKLNAIGYENDSCMKSKLVTNLLKSIDEIDSLVKLYEENKEKEVIYDYENHHLKELSPILGH